MQPLFDRTRLSIKPLHARQSKSDTSCMLSPSPMPPNQIPKEPLKSLERVVAAIREARKNKAPVMLAYGAHLFKNGLAPLAIQLMEQGHIQHLATNGAGSIHDWEMAFQGKTEEDVKHYIQQGQFGIWQETGGFLNLAVTLGTAQGLGYGASVGKMIAEDRLVIPDMQELRTEITQLLESPSASNLLARKSNLLHWLQTFPRASGSIAIPHPWKQFSIQHKAYELNIPFSVCPGIGADIIYTHPWNSGCAIGEGAVQDFLSFADSVSKLEGGVFLSVGSAVMAPMIFEKAISMSRNLALQENRSLENYHIFVIDIQPGSWDWHQGEPPKNHPAYYLRFCKSFSRMGGKFEYLEMDNRLFFQYLCQELN
ncbi:MAG: hypothetical protein HQM12_00620 [SAR324 cluster bacterium]|nr:hypothetical protein [SAR324 cluster bacterium]